jgi:drug/metabolite transporter (DMT)-like permease
VLPALGAKTAANAQLAVPVIAALAGVALLGEPIGWRLAVAAAAVLGGIALAARTRRVAT